MGTRPDLQPDLLRYKHAAALRAVASAADLNTIRRIKDLFLLKVHYEAEELTIAIMKREREILRSAAAHANTNPGTSPNPSPNPNPDATDTNS
jgi:hypothetical protein